jgi:glycosyltransferase involved in cell wall biosynthesis
LPNRAKLRAELHIAEDAVVLLYVGRLTHQKNLFVLVDTLAQLRNKMSQVILLVVGTGELSSPLIQYAEERGVTNVKFCGFIPNDELPRIYGCADFFIMASVYEGQPVALLEAMAAGLPPIVSNIPTMEHLVTESGAGIVVDFSDPAEAAKQIEAYVSSSRAREDCYRVREYVERTMSSSVCAERYLELLGRTVT